MRSIDFAGIAFACPKGERNKDCPILEIEHLSYIERIEFFEHINEEKKKAIIKHHQHCTMVQKKK